MYILYDYPKNWKYSFVHFINKSDGEGLRPISYTSCVKHLNLRLKKIAMVAWIQKPIVQ